MNQAWSLQDLLKWTEEAGVRLWKAPSSDDLKDCTFDHLSTFKSSRPQSLIFFFDQAYLSEFEELVRSNDPSRFPAVVVVGKKFESQISPLIHEGFKKTVWLIAQDPYLAMAMVSEKLAGDQGREQAQADIHPTAVVDASVEYGAGVRIGPLSVIGAGTVIGEGTQIGSHVSIGSRCRIGKNGSIFSHVTLYDATVLGDRFRIHAGVVIGADGFGFAPEIKDGRPLGHRKIFHLGNVEIGNDVEIGANSCIDRATFGSTRIGSMVKLDNLVQIGHNCEVGNGSILCGKVGLSGSVKVGQFVYIGGNAGINNKVTIGDFAKIGGFSAVAKDVPSGAIVWGVPGRTGRDFFRLQVHFDRMIRGRGARSLPTPEMAERVSRHDSALTQNLS